MITCKNCGATLTNDTTVCPYCETILNEKAYALPKPYIPIDAAEFAALATIPYSQKEYFNDPKFEDYIKEILSNQLAKKIRDNLIIKHYEDFLNNKRNYITKIKVSF